MDVEAISSRDVRAVHGFTVSFKKILIFVKYNQATILSESLKIEMVQKEQIEKASKRSKQSVEKFDVFGVKQA